MNVRKMLRARIRARALEEHAQVKRGLSTEERLRWEEGKASFGYIDTTGNVTIGYGFNIGRLELPNGRLAVPPNVRLVPVNPLPDGIAERILDFKLKEVTADLTKALPWGPKLGDIRWSVLLDLAYNMGWRVLVNGWPNFLENVRLGQFESAADKLRHSKW
jgi:GH24 family phage-related lysozyme (muramidase)